jgi:transposase
MALKGRRSTSEERLRAVQLLKEGNEAATIARMFNVSRAILFRWQQKYDQGGPVALETKKTPGPGSRLSPTQLSKLYAIITGSDPRQLQFDFGLWTRKIIRELIRREFGVKLSEVQVGRLLKKMGLSPQRPLYRAYQQDPERVAEWKKSVYPKIRKLAAEEGASIFFADEASIRTDHHAGTTWVPVGQTPGRHHDRRAEVGEHGIGDFPAR